MFKYIVLGISPLTILIGIGMLHVLGFAIEPMVTIPVGTLLGMIFIPIGWRLISKSEPKTAVKNVAVVIALLIFAAGIFYSLSLPYGGID